MLMHLMPVQPVICATSCTQFLLHYQRAHVNPVLKNFRSQTTFNALVCYVELSVCLAEIKFTM